MSTAKMNSKAFKFNKVSYYRCKAEDLVLGCYGTKKSPALKPNYLDVADILPDQALGQVKVHVVEPAVISWEKESRTDVDLGAALKYIKLAGGLANFNYAVARNADLKLVKFSIWRDPLRRVLNDFAPEALECLRKGVDRRIVSAVWVAMEAELADTITTGAGVEIEATVKGVELKVKAKKTSTSTMKVTLGTGTTFAYQLHKVKKWSKGRVRIEDLEDDQQGSN